MFCCCWCWWLLGAIVVYKILDWLIRIPKLDDKGSRHILVTGCDSGFGYEVAKRLDQLGCHVFAGCLTEKGETELKKQCSTRLHAIHLDVTRHDSVQAAFTTVKNKLPPGRGLWGLLNNAGIAGSRAGPAQWLRLADYHEVFAVNLNGLIDMTVTFLPLIKQSRGRVVCTSSVFGRYSLPGSAPYTVSKYGVQAFADSLRREMKLFGVRVHLIEPGIHKTNISSTQTLGGGMQRAWDDLSPELKLEYGEEFLNTSIKFVVSKLMQNIASSRLSDVVDAYEHALLGRFPRARYVVGKDAKYVWLPLQWIPEWLGDYVLNNVSKHKPVPAACKL